ncbi:hypothetical protein [Streptomonospora salina]|uniref:Uncharacterized protein n=1 Tax=Streptomonospora salina TaxID=104205 RepID=A0A841ECY6_9ACTN|nr:hypothetical protein [Streptomonospora salina]MBB6000856.1 hypothetical protein [Streptomonospora salina]
MPLPNRDLAAAAVDTANANGRGLQRRAAGCAAVVLGSTTTVAGAKKALAQAHLGDEIRAAAEQLIDQLAENTEKETHP